MHQLPGGPSHPVYSELPCPTIAGQKWPAFAPTLSLTEHEKLLSCFPAAASQQMWRMSGGLSCLFTLCSQFLLPLNYLFHALPLTAILFHPFCMDPTNETHVFTYFPETHPHQAVGLNIWVYILEYEDILWQHSRTNHGKVNIGHPVHWQYLPLGTLCSGLSSCCLAGASSLPPVRPHCFSWSRNTWGIQL